MWSLNQGYPPTVSLLNGVIGILGCLLSKDDVLGCRRRKRETFDCQNQGSSSMFLTLGLRSLQVFSRIPRSVGYSGYNVPFLPLSLRTSGTRGGTGDTSLSGADATARSAISKPLIPHCKYLPPARHGDNPERWGASVAAAKRH